MNMHYDDGIGQVRSFARGLLRPGRFALNGHSLTITYAPKSPGPSSASLSLSPSLLVLVRSSLALGQRRGTL